MCRRGAPLRLPWGEEGEGGLLPSCLAGGYWGVGNKQQQKIQKSESFILSPMWFVHQNRMALKKIGNWESKLVLLLLLLLHGVKISGILKENVLKGIVFNDHAVPTFPNCVWPRKWYSWNSVPRSTAAMTRACEPSDRGFEAPGHRTCPLLQTPKLPIGIKIKAYKCVYIGAPEIATTALGHKTCPFLHQNSQLALRLFTKYVSKW